MNGLELSKSYFEEHGKPMLEQEFSELLPYLAVGFVGNGSEHYGFDDEISRDHDYEPGFCIFLPGEDVVDRKAAFKLERAYAKLPKEYKGIKRLTISPVGGSRNGVIRTADYYRTAIGTEDGGLTVSEWLSIPDYALADAVNGEIFFDNYGEFTSIREHIADMPRDILLKRLAGNLLLMGQSGQYNFNRCLQHGETEAAQLAVTEFVTATIKSAFLLNGRYMPYYKWSFRALREMQPDSKLADTLAFLLKGDNSDSEIAREKTAKIETAAREVLDAVFARGLAEADSEETIKYDLERQAYKVNDMISDNEIRNLNILAAV